MYMTKQMEYAKELDDVMMFVVEMVKDIKAKKGAAELAAENLSGLIQAMGGVEQVHAEMSEKKDVAYQTIACRVGELVAVLVG